MRLLKRLTLFVDRANLGNRPRRVFLVRRVLPLVPVFVAIAVSNLLGLSSDEAIWMVVAGSIGGLVLMGWIAWRHMVAIGGTSTRRSERVARKSRD